MNLKNFNFFVKINYQIDSSIVLIRSNNLANAISYLLNSISYIIISNSLHTLSFVLVHYLFSRLNNIS